MFALIITTLDWPHLLCILHILHEVLIFLVFCKYFSLNYYLTCLSLFIFFMKIKHFFWKKRRFYMFCWLCFEVDCHLNFNSFVNVKIIWKVAMMGENDKLELFPFVILVSFSLLRYWSVFMVKLNVNFDIRKIVLKLLCELLLDQSISLEIICLLNFSYLFEELYIFPHLINYLDKFSYIYHIVSTRSFIGCIPAIFGSFRLSPAMPD